nr:clustered mitochondria protein [Ipomoea batatas]
MASVPYQTFLEDQLEPAKELLVPGAQHHQHDHLHQLYHPDKLVHDHHFDHFLEPHQHYLYLCGKLAQCQPNFHCHEIMALSLCEYPQCYGNMALFYHGLNQTELALRHMSRALLLLGLSSGPDHPDVAATFINVAMMYQDIGKMDTALRYLQEALKKNERLLGEDHIQTAVCYHALAIAFNCMDAYKLSHQHEKKTYDILAKLGEEDSRTKDSQNWMNTFKKRELQANPSLLHAFQAATGAAGFGGVNQSLNAAMVGDALPRGRGVDERAARAVQKYGRKLLQGVFYYGLMLVPCRPPEEADNSRRKLLPESRVPHRVKTRSQKENLERDNVEQH